MSLRPREALLLDPTYCTIPLNVMREYKRMNLIENDVLLAQLLGGNRAFVWDSTYDRYRDSRSQDFLEFLRQFRFAMGIIVPLEDEDGFRSFVGLLASLRRVVDISTFNAVRGLGKKAKIKAAELGL
ncbi:autoinducer binding domain-containing protein [Ochrobactrum vermis]|uniref:Autoinducer binding domain-containing protein n=1 Tax=Ochrobactrum vermis TaxID=1827297 RepID=A0ABU8PFW7_9HYPH|nr:autoinducer binding domain-containing protein [Ochrobactrum vermis]